MNTERYKCQDSKEGNHCSYGKLTLCKNHSEISTLLLHCCVLTAHSVKPEHTMFCYSCIMLMLCRRLNGRWMLDSVVLCIHIVVFIFAEEMWENSFNILLKASLLSRPREQKKPLSCPFWRWDTVQLMNNKIILMGPWSLPSAFCQFVVFFMRRGGMCWGGLNRCVCLKQLK